MRKFGASLPEKFEFPTNKIGEKLLKEYGAVFVARNGAIPPTKIIFKSETEVSHWQAGVATSKANVGGFQIELQTAAMKSLKRAITEAEKNKLSITPRGADSARRSYADTVDLWASRVKPALTYWVKEGKLTAAKADKIKLLSAFEQVDEVLEHEEKGIFFSKDLSKSIIYSVAPPGTSQHLSMLALDVAEFGDAATRLILAKHGWFQTVVSDLPHFTFLGVTEMELPDSGLKKIIDDGRVFWIPDM